MKNVKDKLKQFSSGEHSPLPLDIETFAYECRNVLGMEVDEDEVYLLARYLIEHYYLIPTKERIYLRYSIVEA